MAFKLFSFTRNPYKKYVLSPTGNIKHPQTTSSRKHYFSLLLCSAANSCLTSCNPMDCNIPDFPVLHYLLEFAQTHVHWVSDVIKPFHPLSPPSPPALNLSQHQGFFLRNQLFTSGGQSTGASTSASVLPMNIQGWLPLGLTGLISLLSKRLFSSVFSSTTLWKHQFFGTQPSVWSNSHIVTSLLEKPQLTTQAFVGKMMSLLVNMPSRFVITLFYLIIAILFHFMF